MQYPGAALSFTDFHPNHIKTVVDCWNSWLPTDYSIDSRLLDQLTFRHPSWENNHAKLAWQDDKIVGFLLARDFGQEKIVDALAVAPRQRRQGIGTSLLQQLPNGPVRIGGGPSHFLPGLPQDWSNGERFLKNRGFSQDWTAEDLHMPLAPRPHSFCSAKPEDRDSVVAMVREEFSTRWTDDTRARFESGDAADVLLIKEKGEPVAFCQTWHFESKLLGPSVFWLRLGCPRFGGIGPVGVRQDQRGRGLGIRVVEEALNYLWARGVAEVVVDWTSIGPFYEKSGFRVWRRYSSFLREREIGE